MSKFQNINPFLDNLLCKVYVYDDEMKCVPYPDKFDLVLIKDFDKYVENHKSRLYDHQYFVKSSV